MGFRRVLCPLCQKESLHPLATGYVVFYWLLLGFNIVLFGSIVAKGKTFIPSPLGIIILTLVVISLFKNARIKMELAEIEKSLPKE